MNPVTVVRGDDDAGRPLGVDYSDPATPDVTAIGYDGAGRRTSATSGGATETWAWNARSQLTSHTDANGDTTGYDWDKTGNLVEIAYPGQPQPVQRSFDDAGRLESVKDFAGRVTSFGYDADDHWTSTVSPGSSGTANTDLFGFDDAGRMTSATWRQGGTSGTVLGSEIYARTVASKGMVATTAMAGSAGSGSRANVYDARDRLTAAGSESFGYDAASNVTETADGRLQVFDPAQQLCWSSPTVAATASCGTPPADATAFAYDARGNQVRRRTADAAVRVQGFDQANRLVSVVDDSDPSPAPVAEMTGRALVGNFDGDGEDDVFFYRSGGSNDDWVWWGTNRAQFSSATGQFSVSGEFRTATGDFNCDGRDDILWYKPGDGGVNDFVWFWFGRSGGGGNAGGGAYSSKGFDVDFDFTPFSGDFDDDGCTDVFWYAPGSGVDAMWWGDEDVADPNTSFDLGGINVSGSYKPVVGNFDGAAADDIF